MVCSRIKAQVSESDLVTGRKWFLYSTGDSHIIFGPKGTGTLSKVVRKDGYAVQSMSGNTRGSNQYQKKNKSYGATGGITEALQEAITLLLKLRCFTRLIGVLRMTCASIPIGLPMQQTWPLRRRRTRLRATRSSPSGG